MHPGLLLTWAKRDPTFQAGKISKLMLACLIKLLMELLLMADMGMDRKLHVLPEMVMVV